METNRRNLLKVVGGVAALTLFTGGEANAQENRENATNAAVKFARIISKTKGKIILNVPKDIDEGNGLGLVKIPGYNYEDKSANDAVKFFGSKPKEIVFVLNNDKQVKVVVNVEYKGPEVYFYFSSGKEKIDLSTDHGNFTLAKTLQSFYPSNNKK